jgi:hypothetical protein
MSHDQRTCANDFDDAMLMYVYARVKMHTLNEKNMSANTLAVCMVHGQGMRT